MKKTYSKTGSSCRVTFEIPSEVVADTAVLCGDFNGWDPNKHPMKLRKDGRFTLTVSLKPGVDYRFRYLLDGERWENDWAADKYLPNQFGTDDSVISV
jgi:1,4-alpha-glucan branching enzyme